MSVKKLSAVMFIAAAVFAQAAFAQKAPSPGTHITVSKTLASPSVPDGAMYTSIQAAVNAAQPGQVIEILDWGLYEEQVTIDGRPNCTAALTAAGTPCHSWGAGVIGGKNEITIRYVPLSADQGYRPSIKYRDTRNVSPINCTQSRVEGDTVGSSGNFETNGALRIIRASKVKIEGLIIDAGLPSTFAYPDVWSSGSCSSSSPAYPQFHGNAAVAVAMSNGVQIRDCEIRNAHFGIYVKDRNIGGVFSNPNPSDNDYTVPLSGFGKSGYHLFEYNKIHDNDAGIFFESSWDLGSTVRYNLIYNNYYKSGFPSGAGTASDKGYIGGLVFKDGYLSPVAIYNNTFYMNYAHMIGGWQIGYQHLIFNNIFGRPQAYGVPGETAHMSILHKFPNRMKYNIISADGDDPGTGTDITWNNFGPNGARQPGSVIASSGGTSAVNFPSDANNKWLEVNSTYFASVNASAANFLEPLWSNSAVSSHIRNGGWPAAGILNEDGTVADLGAIPQSGKRPGDGRQKSSRVRISPFSVITISGTTTATAKLVVDSDVGSVSNLSIKYIRWISPIPDNTNSWGIDGTIITATAIQTITGLPASLNRGTNTFNLTLPRALGANDNYGFFELVIEGKDANGNTINSDVGFLPFRKLDYEFRIQAIVGGSPVTTVIAGEPVTLRVTARNRSTGQNFTEINAETPLEVAYRLRSSSEAFMYRSITPNPNDPLITDRMVNASKDYTVYFTKAGEEIISGSGVWIDGDRRLPFLGDLVLNVRPGAPEKVAFIDPIPKSQIPSGTSAPGISGDYHVAVQVQDRFGNATDLAVPVSIVSLHPDIGDVLPATGSTTAGGDGNVSFTASVTNGAPGDVFDMRASINYNGKSADDVASLRVGRATDNLRIFYTNASNVGPGNNASGAWREDFIAVEEISKNLGEKAQVWLKITIGTAAGDSVLTGKTGFACITASTDDLLLLTSQTGTGVPGGAGISVPITSGMATFWISANVNISDASLVASARLSADCNDRRDNSISDSQRGNINFGAVSVKSRDRVIPPSEPDAEAVVVPPIVVLAGEFAVGPNPVSKSAGSVGFFRQGRGISGARLAVYDAAGNLVRRISVKDNNIGNTARRQVGSWDLKDRKGRIVGEGTYLLKGTITARDGSKEKVSVVLGVR